MNTSPLLNKCPLHQKKLKILCTNPLCKNPRLCCTKCLFDPAHSNCITKTILLEGLLSKSFTEEVKNWVESPSDRKRLNEIAEIVIPNIENSIILIIKQLDELENLFLQQIKTFFDVLKTKLKENEALKLFRTHFSLINLNEYLSKQDFVTLNEFFSLTSQEFLKVFDNPDLNIALSFDKTLINKVFSDKTLQIKDQFPDFLTTKLQFPEFLPKKLLVPLLKAGNPIHKVLRFRKHEGSIWNFDRKYPDYISFEADRDIRFYGFGMYKTRTIGHKWKVLGQIIEGGNCTGKVLQKKDFVFVNNLDNSDSFIAKLLFEPIDLQAKNLLTLYIWAQGQDTIGGMEGMGGVKNEKDGVGFKFWTTRTKEDNGTNVKVGQIPEIYYSVL